MVQNRLPYETLAGNLSSQDTYKQLLEYLRLAEEDCRTLSRLTADRGSLTSPQWLAIAGKFAQITAITRYLGESRANPSSIGYTGRGEL